MQIKTILSFITVLSLAMATFASQSTQEQRTIFRNTKEEKMRLKQWQTLQEANLTIATDVEKYSTFLNSEFEEIKANLSLKHFHICLRKDGETDLSWYGKTERFNAQLKFSKTIMEVFGEIHDNDSYGSHVIWVKRLFEVTADFLNGEDTVENVEWWYKRVLFGYESHKDDTWEQHKQDLINYLSNPRNQGGILNKIKDYAKYVFGGVAAVAFMGAFLVNMNIVLLVSKLFGKA